MTDVPRQDDLYPGPPPAGAAADSGVSSEDPTRSSAPSRELPSLTGSMWGHLTISEELGRGAYGRVYRAWDEVLAREVALKIIRVERPDPAAVSAVLREGQMLASIRHRNVVTIYGAQQIGEDVGLWMELVRGRPLARIVQQDGPLGADEAAVIGMSLCDALAAVHGAGLLHRDVKAQNVMRESGGRILLMDFGAGREVSGRGAWTEMAGTPIYIAPDVLAGGSWTPAADVYSVGVLLFYLVSGRYPVEGRTVAEIALAHALGQQRLLVDCRAGLPEPFVRVVQRALAQKYRTAGAMMRDLSEVIAGGTGSWRDVPAPPTPDAVRTSPEQSTGVRSDAVLRRAPSLSHRATSAAVALGGVWLAGFVASMAFNQSFGRTEGFSSETPFDWLTTGVRALFGPASYVVLALVVIRLIRALWRGTERLLPPARAAGRAVRLGASALGDRIGLRDRTTAGQWLLAAEVASVVAVCWVFRDFILACATFLDTAPGDALRQLDPSNDASLFFRLVLSILAFAAGWAWYRLLTSGAAVPVDRTTAAAGIALTALVVVLVAAPYKLLHQSSFRRVEFGGARCYITGTRGAELLLFCPDAVPRNHIASANDPQLKRLTVVESAFSPPAGGGP
ncbi:MAG TPA: serine/threonine-protein kinase [Vicinamibacterales bacterium]|nr:serine/threonine-protein kinase [Vicinamibacterales bacterium]